MALNFKKLISPNGTAKVFTNGTHDVFDKKDVYVEVKGEPYEFNTFEEMEEFLRSDESKYGDIVKYTGAWDTKQYFQFGLMKAVPNDNGIYPRVPILFNTDLTNDEVKQIITNANLTFNYANSLNGIPFNEYIIFSGKIYNIGDTPSDNGVMYENNIRVSLISSDAFSGEYVIFAFENDNPVPNTWWSSIDIPDLNISNGWNYNNVALVLLYKAIFDSTYDGASVGLSNDELTKLVGIFDDSLNTSEEYNDGNYFIITNDNNDADSTDKSKYFYKLINQLETDLSFDVTENGAYHVKGFEKVNVNVASSGESTLKKLLDYTKSCYYMFYRSTITDLTGYLEYADTENVTTMYGMFQGCDNLTTIPQLDTSNVTNMTSMFQSCVNLTTIPQLDTSNVTNMHSMFSVCKKLTTIPQLNTSKVTDMGGMFFTCEKLISIPSLNTSKVTDMGEMFSSCYELTSVPEMDTSSVTKMSYMFNKCYHLKNIPTLNTSKVTDMGGMFYNCSNLETIPQIDATNGRLSYAFCGCTNLKKIDLFSINGLTSTSYSNYMASSCYSLKKFIVRTMTRIPVLHSNAFNSCYHLTGTVNETYNPNGDKDCFIYVPDDYVEQLKVATNWSTYASQIKGLSELVED